VSTVLGIAVALLSLRLALALPPRCPGFWANVHSAGAPRSVQCPVMTLQAFLLALPFPPLPPFTNSLPCYALILIAASMMEEDGILIWIG